MASAIVGFSEAAHVDEAAAAVHATADMLNTDDSDGNSSGGGGVADKAGAEQWITFQRIGKLSADGSANATSIGLISSDGHKMHTPNLSARLPQMQSWQLGQQFEDGRIVASGAELL